MPQLAFQRVEQSCRKVSICRSWITFAPKPPTGFERTGRPATDAGSGVVEILGRGRHRAMARRGRGLAHPRHPSAVSIVRSAAVSMLRTIS
jgi:hypothetical protein